MAGPRPDRPADGMICLRPHHLLCLMGFQGKGYNEAFVSRMTEVSNLLKKRPNTQIRLKAGVDDLCAACPHKTDAGVCDHSGRVLACDERTLQYLHLREGTASYDEWMRSVQSGLTDDIRAAICGDCTWTKVCLLAQSYSRERTDDH